MRPLAAALLGFVALVATIGFVGTHDPMPRYALPIPVEAPPIEAPIAETLPAAVERVRLPALPDASADDESYFAGLSFASVSDACLFWARSMTTDNDKRDAFLQLCEHRIFHATRYRQVVSKVDGSQIHDRDRWAAWIVYQRAVAHGWLDPDRCPEHRIDRTIEHPDECKAMAAKLTEKKRVQWLAHPHDVERFGTRGRLDLSANAFADLEGLGECLPPESLDRPEVASWALVARADRLCGESCTLKKLRSVW